MRAPRRGRIKLGFLILLSLGLCGYLVNYAIFWFVKVGQIRGIESDTDAPFHIGCVDPDIDEPRANATILMLARNSDLDGAIYSIKQFERHFNRWFQYPYTFLNNQPFSEDFKAGIATVTNASVEFGVIPSELWDFPPDVDPTWIQNSLNKQGDESIMYGTQESYHKMCRFFSGMFYKHPIVQKYDWYWRVEPDVEFYCDIPYDVFREMEKHNKVYGFNVFLGELKPTVLNLFRHTQAFKRKMSLSDTDLWPTIADCPSAPLGKDASDRMDGCQYNLCHFWSNLEIARFDLWRNDLYESYFQELEAAGGFWHERWGDAPVHTLAVSMFLNSSQVHYFRDIGYSHTKIGRCPGNAAGRQSPLPQFPLHADSHNDTYWSAYDSPRRNGVGCRCRCVNELINESERFPCFWKKFAPAIGRAGFFRNRYGDL